MYWLYLLLVGLFTALGLTFLIRIFLKPLRGGKIGFILFFLVSAFHDMFLNLIDPYDAIPLKCVEYFLYYSLAGLIIWYFFEGRGIINFIMVYAADFVYQAMATMGFFLLGGILHHFDHKLLEKNSSIISLENIVLFFATMGIGIFFARILIHIFIKTRSRVRNIIAVVLAGTNMLAEAISSAESLYVVVPTIVVVLFVGMLYQEKKLKQLEKEENYYQMLEERQRIREEELTRIRHDLANHISVSDSAQNREYAKEILKNIDAKIRSGLPVLDCLLDEKIKACEAKQIEYQEEMTNLSGTTATNFDWVSLFANLLDNAMEACEAAGTYGKIEMHSQRKGDYLLLTVTNSKNPDSQPIQNKFRSTKQNAGGGHGYGTKIIKEIVEKYDGRIRYEDMGENMRIHIIMHVWESGEH